jgi:hypothetical protein
MQAFKTLLVLGDLQHDARRHTSITICYMNGDYADSSQHNDSKPTTIGQSQTAQYYDKPTTTGPESEGTVL